MSGLLDMLMTHLEVDSGVVDAVAVGLELLVPLRVVDVIAVCIELLVLL